MVGDVGQVGLQFWGNLVFGRSSPKRGDDRDEWVGGVL